jgi:methionyl-tRNA formyltransferase
VTRVVFFGLDGAFSTVALGALAASGLAPALVVHGVDAPRHARGPVLERRPARGLMADVRARLERTGRTLVGAARAAHDLTEAAHGLGVDVVRTSDANQRGVLELIGRASPDVLVVAGFSHLLSPAVLALARSGGLNVHPGRLPEERGPAPVFWALKRGRNPLTVTLHVLDAGEDSGDVVSAHEVAFPPGLDGLALHQRLAEAAAPHLARTVRAMVAGDLVRFPQRRAGVARCPRPTFRDGRIDASRPAVEVFTFVAACARHHSLWVECAGDRFFVASARSHDPDARMAYDFVLTGDRLLLACSPGVVELQLKEEGALFSAEYEDPEHPA